MAKKVPTRAVPAITALLVEKAALGDGGGGWSEADGSDAGLKGAGGEAVEGVGAEVGDLAGGVVEGDGAGEVFEGVGAGVGDAFGDGVGVAAGGAETGAGGVAVGGVAVGGVAVGGEAVGAAPGACAMHEVAKRPKIIKTWNPAKPIFIFKSQREKSEKVLCFLSQRSWREFESWEWEELKKFGENI